MCRTASADNPWALIDQWPKELDGSSSSLKAVVNGRSAAVVIQDLKHARRLVQRVSSGLESWSQIVDIEKKVALFPSSLLGEFSQFVSKLPAVYPEKHRLVAMVDSATHWGKAWADLAEELQKVEQLHEDGEDDLAVELLGLLQEKWPTYSRLEEVRTSLCSGRLPWDTVELRTQIRTLVSAGNFRTARTKLSLLPATAMPQIRQQVRSALHQAEIAVTDANVALAKGDSFVAVHRFSDAERCCRDLPFVLMGKAIAESVEATRQVEFARESHTRSISKPVSIPPRKPPRKQDKKESAVVPNRNIERAHGRVGPDPTLLRSGIWFNHKVLLFVLAVMSVVAAIAGVAWMLWT